MESRYEKSLQKDIKNLQKVLGELLKQEREKSTYGDITTYSALVDIDKSTIYKGERGDLNFTISRLYTLLRANGKSHQDIIGSFTQLITNTYKETDFSIPSDFEQQVRLQVKSTLGEEVAKSLKSTHVNRIYFILVCCNNKTLKKTELKNLLKLESYTKHFNKCLKIAHDTGWINMTNPEKPNANDQSYYTTEAGKEVLRLKQDTKG